MKLQFKVGTYPLSVIDLDYVPVKGDRLDLPFPTCSTKYPVIITEIFVGSRPEECIFYGEWM